MLLVSLTLPVVSRFLHLPAVATSLKFQDEAKMRSALGTKRSAEYTETLGRRVLAGDRHCIIFLARSVFEVGIETWWELV
jgi:hypothetical protein